MQTALPELPDVHELLDEIPGGALGLSGGGLFAVLVVVAVLANQGTPAERAEFNRSIERFFGNIGVGIARYASGRELNGQSRSEATWWRAGAPLPDDEKNETPVDKLGARATAPASFEKSRRERRTLRAAGAPLRVLWRSLGGLRRVLVAWHRWPRALGGPPGPLAGGVGPVAVPGRG